MSDPRDDPNIESRFLQDANEKLAQPGDPTLLPGESMQVSAKNVSIVCPYNGVLPGTLYLSTYKITFSTSEHEPQLTYVAPMGAVNTAEKVGGASSKGEHSYGLDIQFKDFRAFRFAFKHEGHSRRVVFETIQRLAFPMTSGRPLFAFEFGIGAGPSLTDANSSTTFDMKVELARIGVPSEFWKFTTANESYQLCNTYPSVLAVPTTLTDEQLTAVAGYRSRARLPTLSWLHPENQSSMCRCAQPLVGKFGKRSKDDESFMTEIRKTNPHCEKIVMLDARPKLNAIANKAMGGGYEDEENYQNMELVFMDIGNIHVMRDSLKKLRDMCYPTTEDAHWMSSLENTHWFEHMRLVLAASVRIVELMDQELVSVVVHCSDGWDRTSQLCALAMLMMDPYYRTIAGFGVLIEKEWLAFGHKFQQRYGHGDRHAGDEQRSPIFVQFIEAVWQMTIQFPCAFEFNENFLLTILDHLYSCLYGTFLCNSEKERKPLQGKTVSLWSEIAKDVDEYTNPLYSMSSQPKVLYLAASIRRFQFWAGYYMRWNPEMRPHESEHDRTQELYRVCLHLKKQCASMQKQLNEKSAAASASLQVGES